MDDVDVSAIVLAWGVNAVETVETVRAGNNNRTYAVAAGNEQFLLRIYQNVAQPEPIHREHALLGQLCRMTLSFRVPATVPLPSGATLLELANSAGPQYAALFERIAGQQPENHNVTHFHICGAALGELHAALACVNLDGMCAPRPEPRKRLSFHPLVPEPLAMIHTLPLEPAQRKRVLGIAEALVADLPLLYQSLPQQIVHCDFDASNVLVNHNRVSGVLDFEFAAVDLRAYDVARSLSMFGISPWNMPNGWALVEAFARGYQQRIRLSKAEVAALPALMRLSRMWSLIHREGCRRQGFATMDDVLARANGLLKQEAWLNERGDDVKALFIRSSW